MESVVQRAVYLHLPKNKKIDIEFNDIFYTVPNDRKSKKQVLKGVSGKFKSGELTAIMGPSGAGKTSLLNILTGFQTSGMQGTIKSNGSLQKKIGAQKYKKESCYILQDDQLSPFFTVLEIMTMAADLKLGSSISEKAKNFLIDDILDTLSLTATKDTRCQRLSGGQKKRLSVALELIDNPPIMFLDEPTTGLDSSSSSQCISMLKALARQGRTIICTIHQPSASIYEMFDHIYVLAEGKCIYQGGSLNTVAYLSSLGFNCPQYHNPADYLLEVANGEYGNYTELLSRSVLDNTSQWRSSIGSPINNKITELQVDKKEPIITDSTYEDEILDHDGKSLVLVSPPSELMKFTILLNRAFLQMYRDWTISHLRILLHIIVGMILGFTYYRSGEDGSKTISNVGFLLVSAVYLCYTSLMPAVLKFPSEMAVLRKERFNNWYHLKTYYAAFLVSDIPMQIIFSVAYSSTSYFISAQPPDLERFLMFVLILILTTLTSSSLGIVIGTTLNPINGTFTGAILLAVMLSVAGFLMLLTHMPYFMYLLSYASFITYSMEGLVESIYGFGRASIPCPDNVEYCHYKAPDMVLRELGMNHNNYWWDVVFLSTNFVLLKIVAFCTLRRRLSSSTKN